MYSESSSSSEKYSESSSSSSLGYSESSSSSLGYSESSSSSSSSENYSESSSSSSSSLGYSESSSSENYSESSSSEVYSESSSSSEEYSVSSSSNNYSESSSSENYSESSSSNNYSESSSSENYSESSSSSENYSQSSSSENYSESSSSSGNDACFDAKDILASINPEAIGRFGSSISLNNMELAIGAETEDVSYVPVSGAFTNRRDMIVVNGNPAIAYFDSTKGQIRYIRALDANGYSWGEEVIVDPSVGTTNKMISMEIVGGNPAIAYIENIGTSSLRFARSNNVDGGDGSWQISTVDSVSFGSIIIDHEVSLSVINGNPAIAYFDARASFPAVYYKRASTTTGSSDADWSGARVKIEDSINTNNNGGSLTTIGGRPAFAWDGTGSPSNGLKYVRANDADGADWAGGINIEVDMTGTIGIYTSLIEVNGKPAIAYINSGVGLKYIRADNAFGSSWTGTKVTVDNTLGTSPTGVKMLIVGGSPAIGFRNGSYIRSDNINGSAWTDTPIEVFTSQNNSTSFTIANGRPAFASRGLTSSFPKTGIYFQRADDANGTSWDGITDAGRVHFYDWNGADWDIVYIINSGNPESGFGVATSLQGDRVAVGTSGENGGLPNSGRAYYYEKILGDWKLKQTFTSPNVENNGGFGARLIMNGDNLVISASAENGAGDNRGNVYAYRWNGTSWSFLETIISPIPEDFAQFGASFSIQGNRLIIGDFIRSSGGAVHAYDWSGTSWSFVETITSPNAKTGDLLNFGGLFSYSTSLEDDTLIVGARFEDGTSDKSGRVYIYDWNGSSYIHTQTLESPNHTTNGKFGSGVSLSKGRVAIGAQGEISNSVASGRSYVYTLIDGTWERTDSLVSSTPIALGEFGHNIALQEDLLVGSARNETESGNTLSGHVHCFECDGAREHSSSSTSSEEYSESTSSEEYSESSSSSSEAHSESSSSSGP
jgi:hypothetical protein